MIKLLFRRLAAAGLALTLQSTLHAAPPMLEPFGTTHEGVPVQIYTLRNANGCEARITNYGAIIVSLEVPDRHGDSGDVVLGFDRLEDYLAPAYVKKCPYFGAFIGRYGNRIDKGKFLLDGHAYQIPPNDGPNALHGGPRGFDKRVWNVDNEKSKPGAVLALSYVSPDGEEGFPGTVTTHIVYTLTDQNELRLAIEATTDQPTVINLTQHSYFNLKGAGNGDILDHQLTIRAARFVPIDTNSIPLGNLEAVAGTPFDFNQPTAVGARINADDEQLRRGKGYDHNFVLDGYVPGATQPRVFARLEEESTGRVLEVASTQPGVQFYSGNFLDGSLHGKAGKVYEKHGGLCLEPQHYPDSPNHPAYPSVVLRPGETYRDQIVYRFSTEP